MGMSCVIVWTGHILIFTTISDRSPHRVPEHPCPWGQCLLSAAFQPPEFTTESEIRLLLIFTLPESLLSSSYHQKQAQTRGESTSWYNKLLSLLFVLYVLISQFAINHHPRNQTLSYLYILFENTFQFPFTWTALSFATPAECINLHSTLWIYLRSLMTHTRHREHNLYRESTSLKSVMQLHTEGCVIISK